MYPKLEINIEKLKTNLQIISNLLKKRNISLTMVTKAYCANPDIINELVKDKNLIDYLADSRIENLKGMKHIDIPKILLRLPMKSEVEDVIKYADISFNSEYETIEKLNEKAKKVNDLKPSVFLPQSKIDEYKEKIKEGYLKLKSEKEKLEDVINKKKELEENKIKVENGLKELKENEDFLLKNSEKLKLEEENYYRTYNDNQKKFKNAYKQIEDAKKKIEDGSTKLIDARTELNTKKLDLENKIEFLVAPIYSVGSRFDNFSFSVLYNNTQSMKIMSIIFPLCFFIIVLFVVTTTMIRFTYEQRKSIGLYRFLGYGKTKIYAKFLIYALIPTIIGIILGSLVGTYLLPKIIYPPFVTDFIPIFKELNIVFIPKYTIIIFLIFVLTITFTIIIVVSKEIKENIVSLLIGKETNIAKRILIEKSRLWQKLKFSAKILLRNIFKYKGRLIMTIIGIGGCTALIYLGISLDDSIKNITKYQYTKVRKFDATVYFNYNVTDTQKEEYINKLKSIGLFNVDPEKFAEGFFDIIGKKYIVELNPEQINMLFIGDEFLNFISDDEKEPFVFLEGYLYG